MTLSLYVLRHAKAEETSTGGDHERSLKGRGRKAARLIGKTLARLGETPDLVLCSTAMRARETAELARDAGEFHAPIDLRRSIYEATPESLLEEVRSIGPDAERVLLVGHEPGLSLLIGLLAGGEPDFPTCALARIDLELESWGAVRPRAGGLVWMLTPELIEGLRSKNPMA